MGVIILKHEHEHEHGHHHHHATSGKNLFITIILNVIITLAQVVGGIVSGSLALLSDALHNFSDVMALVIAWWAKKISARESSEERTFGYKRAQIIAALFNSSVLLGIGLYLIVEGVKKFLNPEVIDSNIVIYLAILSIVLNAASVLLIKNEAHDNLNMKAAYLHLLTDVMTSVAVLIGGIGMYFFELFWIDPLISIAIALYLMRASYTLIKESTSILMQFTPTSMDVKIVQQTIIQNPSIANVHHMHLWQLDDKSIHLEAHVDFCEDLVVSQVSLILQEIEHSLKEEHFISHVTLQAEFGTCESKNLIYNEGCKHV